MARVKWRRTDHLLELDDGTVVAMLRDDALDLGDLIVTAMNAASETRGVTATHNGLTPTARILELEELLEQAKREAEEACQHARVVIGQRDAQRARREESEANASRLQSLAESQEFRAEQAERKLAELRAVLEKGAG